MSDDQRRIYVVMQGEYSDRHIVGIYDNREMAEEYVRLNSDSEADYYTPYVKEYPLNPYGAQLRDGLATFAVEMEADGTVLEVVEHRVRDDSQSRPSIYAWPAHPGTLSIKVWARDVEHAIKIANEQRVMWLAEEPERLPLLERRKREHKG